MQSENDKDRAGTEDTFTGRDVLYREGAVGLLEVQRAADALLRQGRKPSVAAIREHLGGGSPNTITPLLAKYWEKLGGRLGAGPESLERVPEALARVTELLWRRALEEARERLKILQRLDHKPGALEELQEQIGKLSVALAEARAKEGEQLTHLAALTSRVEEYRLERGKLLALLKGTQTLLKKQDERPRALANANVSAPKRPSNSIRPKKRQASKRAIPNNRKRRPGRGKRKRSLRR